MTKGTMGPLTREANRDLFLIILVESHVVLSNDEKKGRRQEEKKTGRKRESESRRDSRAMAGDKVGCLGVFPG